VPKIDQRIFDDQRQEFLESGPAAAFLGVQQRTLYAYVSRGLISRVRAGRRSRYARADLVRLKARHDARSGHGPVAGAALQWGEPVLATRISQIGPGGPRYRGHLATDLARRQTPFLAVCQLLWTGTLAVPAAAARRPGHPTVRSGGDPVVRLMEVALAGLRRWPAPFGLAADVELARARSLVLGLAGAAGPRRGKTDSADPATRFLESFALAATPVSRRLVDAALVLCADHELNASTFAARVAASTGADLHACLLAALGTFVGPRHGTASRSVEALLDQVARPARAEAIVRARTTSGDGLAGFGHPLYPGGDPRAAALLTLVQEIGASGPGLRTLRAVIDAAGRIRGERPSIDAALVAVSLAVGLPRGAAAALFAVGRAAGWVAHVLEQRLSPTILRPRARFVGPDLPPVPG
jgi:citrate synthase